MYNEFNGNIEDANIDASAAIAVSKISGAVTTTTTQSVTGQKTFTSPLFIGSVDGWIGANETWTYASASTFTVAGVDVTSKYTKGTYLKFTQTTVKYAVVVASSFSTNTTVTIAVNTDYTIANAAISANYYSYQANPQGYPGWFAYTPTWTGFSADPTYAVSPRFCVIGTTCFMRGVASANGTSNSANMYMTLPVEAGQSTSLQNAGRAVDNGAILTSPAMVNFTSGSDSAIWSTQAGTGFTASGAKSVNWNFEYEI